MFGKAPRPGAVKTRLTPAWSPEQAADLYREMLADVLEASGRFARDLGLEPVLAFDPPDAAGALVGLAPPGFRLHPQRGAGLAERMAFAVAEARAAGAERVLVRGSDSPALPGGVFEAAMRELDRGADVVLTPDQGGGYALIGLRAADARIFDLPMSIDSVFEQTMARAASIGWRSAQTEAGFDVDNVGDLQLLSRLSHGEASELCPRTVEYLSTVPGWRVL